MDTNPNLKPRSCYQLKNSQRENKQTNNNQKTKKWKILLFPLGQNTINSMSSAVFWRVFFLIKFCLGNFLMLQIFCLYNVFSDFAFYELSLYSLSVSIFHSLCICPCVCICFCVFLSFSFPLSLLSWLPSILFFLPFLFACLLCSLLAHWLWFYY